MMDYCVGCTTEMLPHLDDDPNGASNATCARCRAEEAQRRLVVCLVLGVV